MTPETVVLVGAGALFVITTVSGWLERLLLTEPLVAMILGTVVGAFLADPIELETPPILTVLELTLALVLFSDASRINVMHLRDGYPWPLRMLMIGLPLVVVLGAIFSSWYLSLPLGLAMLLAAVLAPTDAALAEPVLGADEVPARVRQALNVESGLNDGLAVPLLLIAIGIIDAEEGGGVANAVSLVFSQLGIGVVGGLVVGWLGATIIGRAGDSGRLNLLHQKVAAVALALVGFSAVQLLGGSGFVAVFIAGGLMSYLLKSPSEYIYQFAEAEGHSLVLIAFFIVGAGPVTRVISEGVSPQAVVVALVSLFVLRPFAIWLSLLDQRLSRRTVVFLGWFGPRGLATVVFLLVAVGELGALPTLVEDVITTTVILSVALHGLSALPMSRWLGGMEMDETMPEMGEAYAHPTRRGSV
ncbi:MAG TPA: cation:proton antiporter [Acidimicrobiia bacterium]